MDKRLKEAEMLKIFLISFFFISTAASANGMSKSVAGQTGESAKLAAGISAAQERKPTAERDTSKTDLEMQLEKDLAAELGVAAQEEGVAPASPRRQSARRSLFQNMNPNISAIGTAIGAANTLDEQDRNIDFSFEEAEFSFEAVVDPYAKANFFIAFGKENESLISPPGGVPEEGEEESGLQAELEEAFITFLSLPFSTQLKVGKFRSRFGKINETHPHAYNFIDIPLLYGHFLGGEGLNDEGVGLSWLLPNPKFFQELTVQVTSGPLENNSFTRAEDNTLLYLAHLKNFFDVNDNTTLEIGITGLTGPNDETGETTRMLAADLTIKWKPLQRNRYHSIEFLNEFLLSKRNGAVEDVTSIGFYSNLRYQFAKRWFIGGLFDYAEYPQFDQFNVKAYSGILQFFATEFQKAEFQYKYNDPNFSAGFSEFKLRAVFVIGAHGAHQY